MNVKQMIKKLGGSGVVARSLGLPEPSGPAAVRGWVMRDSIPPRWFNAVAELAEHKGADAITVQALLRHAENRRSRPRQAA